ncbi:hypothetical protein IW261DRAFT_1597887 [Armillaria novae-zelandiae]|uniref:Glycoside hydrolase family 76 protein n=1 Tax=Armillaria novae-zelandiae TaxID=153914 RepID=A0AA39NNG8_9AGAR|nr:hypothetical protein IW261DRAFT_1597887 [Armillaria novae-zelandiae]
MTFKHTVEAPLCRFYLLEGNDNEGFDVYSSVLLVGWSPILEAMLTLLSLAKPSPQAQNTRRAVSLPGVQMHLVFISTLLTFSPLSVVAQELKPSTTWRSPNITLSMVDCIRIADSAIREAMTQLNQTNGQFTDGHYGSTGVLYAEMVDFDRLTNQTIYKDTLKNYFALAHCMLYCEFMLIQLVYGDPEFLNIAANSWASGRRYTISSEQAASRTIETKQFTLASCNPTLAGGTYWMTDANDPSLDSWASGMFFVVSALLAEATSNQTYVDATVESGTFIQSSFLTQTDIVWTGIFSSSNHSSSCSRTSEVSSQGSGNFIEGLVIQTGILNNTSTQSLLRSVISGVTTDPRWRGEDGVYDLLDNGGEFIVRALASLYESNKTSSDLREYIKEYIGVQYNAVIEQARSSKESSIYGGRWTGPPATSFHSINQTNALAALLSAIRVLDNPDSEPSAIPTSSATASSTKKNLAGVVAGSVIGGVVVFTASLAGTLFWRKLRRQRNDSPLVADGSPQIPVLTPFTTTQDMSSSGILREHHLKYQVKSPRFPQVAMEGEPFFSGPVVDNASLVERVGANVPTQPRASPGTQVANPENQPLDDRREHTPMEELLGSLNAWTSPDRWNAEEPPPDYHEG